MSGPNVLKVLSEVAHKGYVVRNEIHALDKFHASPMDDHQDSVEIADEMNEGFKDAPATIEMEVAYTVPGDLYIGDPKTAAMLCGKYGIAPQLAASEARVCTIGFSERDQKWYGWSHRAIFGFTIGDTVMKGDCTASSGLIQEYLDEHPDEDRSLPVGFKAKTLDDARRMAIAFADSVG